MKNRSTSQQQMSPVERSRVRNAVRGSARSTAYGSRPPAWYLRKRIVFPLAFIAFVITTAVYCLLHIPVTNPLTGEEENLGTVFGRAAENVLKPKQSLDVSFSGHKEITVLLVGLDHVPVTKIDPGIIRRSDSVMVASTSFETKQVRVISLPRDGWVEHWQNGRTYGYERLGNTYSLGQEEGLRHGLGNHAGGIQRINESVTKLLDMPMDFYIIIEFEGLVELVDAVGGLVVDVEMDMHRDDNAGNLHIHIDKGEQLLTGEQVVHYARFRDQKLADLGRMPRQQKVVRLLLQEMMQAKHRSKLLELAQIMSRSVRTNMTPDQLIALAQHLDEYAPDCIKTKTLESYYDSDPMVPDIQCPGVPEGTKIGAQCIYPRDANRAREWLNDLAPPPPPEPEIEVEPELEPAAAN